MPLKSCIENEGFTLVQVLPLICTTVSLHSYKRILSLVQV